MKKKIKIIGIIPAHLNSIRFPNKIIHKIFDIPMIEHVRRRAKLAKYLDEIYVATNSQKISKLIHKYHGKTIRTVKKHQNGTSRCAEAIKKISCTHAIIIQGDEPLLLPRHLDSLSKKIKLQPNVQVWNAISDLDSKAELDRYSFVKCSIQSDGKINYFFRRSPAYSSFNNQKKYIKKVLGILAFKKNVLLNYKKIKKSTIEEQEFIEQMSMITNNYKIHSSILIPSLPSVNEKKELSYIYKFVKKSKEQKDILKKIKIKY